MSGLNYVGSDYTSDNNPLDLVSKLDVDSEFATAPVSRIGTQSAINTAVGALASQVSVNNALAAYIQPAFLAAQEAPLIPLTAIGAPAGVAPLNSSGIIPSQYVPSLGAGYCRGPYGPTAVFAATAGAAPVKICDWSIGPLGIVFQPVVFMSALVSATNGGRPVIEVRMSAGIAPYSSQTLIARGIGRSGWNDLQSITTFPVPATTGHTGAGGSAFASTFNVWLTAWVFDANSQSVSVNVTNIATAGAYFIRTSL